MPTSPKEAYCKAIVDKATEAKWQLSIGPFLFCWILPNGDEHKEFHYSTNAKDALHAACTFFEKKTTTIEVTYE
jgi:hypothetical protein